MEMRKNRNGKELVKVQFEIERERYQEIKNFCQEIGMPVSQFYRSVTNIFLLATEEEFENAMGIIHSLRSLKK